MFDILEDSARSEAAIERLVQTAREAISWSDPLTQASHTERRCAAALDVLARSPEVHHVEVRLRLEGGGETSVTIEREARATSDQSGAKSLPERDREFDSWLAFLWPNATFRTRPTQSVGLSVEQILLPTPVSLATRTRKPALTLVLQNASGVPLIERLGPLEFNISGALDALSNFAPCELVLKIEPTVMDGRMHSALDRINEFNFAGSSSKDWYDDDPDVLDRFLKAMRADSRAIRISASVRAPNNPIRAIVYRRYHDQCMDRASFWVDAVSAAIFASHATAPGVVIQSKPHSST